MTTPPNTRAAVLEVDEEEASESLCVSVAPRSPPAGGVLYVCLTRESVLLHWFPVVHSCDSCHRRLQLALVVPVRQRLDLVNNACSCAKLVAFSVRRVVPELVHDIQFMRDALLVSKKSHFFRASV